MTFKTPQTLSDISNTFLRCVFTNCTSSASGGSLSASYTILPSSIDLTLKDCEFKYSKTDNSGGAIAVILDGSTHQECRLTVDIEYCFFSNTTANLDITDCSSSLIGGFLHLDQNQTEIDGKSVISCDNIRASSCTSGNSGGFFYFSQKGSLNLTISSSTITSLSSGGYGAFIYCMSSNLHNFPSTLATTISDVSFSDLSCQRGCLLHADTFFGQISVFLTLDNVTATKFDSTYSGALISLDPSSVALERECVIQNCHFTRESVSPSNVICQHNGTLRMESTIIIENNPQNHAMFDLSPNTTLILNMCQLVNSANRGTGLNYNLISGPLGPDNFVECSEVIFSVNSPTCAGYVVTFDTLPEHISELFASCLDTSTASSFPSVVDKTGNHSFSINSETREIFVNEESGRDWNMCGFRSHPCSSIQFSTRVSSPSAFSISALGEFTSPDRPIVLASPCMRLTSDLKFILETDRNDGVFFRAGQSSTYVRDIDVSYTGQHRISLFFLSHTPSSKFEINLDKERPPLNNIALFSSDSPSSTIESSTFETFAFSGSSTFLGASTYTLIIDSSFKTIQSAEPFFRLSSSSLDLVRTLFQFCHVESDAIFVVEAGSILFVESSMFQGCSGREAGVALFKGNPDAVSTFKKVTLISNRHTRKEGDGQAMSTLFGNDLTIRSKKSVLNISNSRSSSHFPRVVVGDSENAEAVDMFAQKQSVFHLESSGTDSHECGDEDKPCCTLQFTIAVTNETNKNEEMTTLLPSGQFREISVFVGRRSILLNGRGFSEFHAPKERDGLMLKIDDSSVVWRQIVFRLTTSVYGSFVSSTKSSLTMDDCSLSSFLPVSDVSSSGSPLHTLFSISSGSLDMSRLQTFNFQLTSLSSALLFVDESNFNLEDTTLSYLSITSESGLMCGTVQHTRFDLNEVTFEELKTASNCGILNLTVIDNGSVCLTETTFTNIRITYPLISLTLSSSLHMTTTTSIVLAVPTLHVRTCDGMNIAGSVVFIDNPHSIQWTLAEPESRMDLLGIEWDSFVEKRGADEARSLFDSLIPLLPQYVVKDSVNNDVIDCGSPLLPCSSIDFAVCQIHPHRTNAVGVILISSVDLKKQLSDTRCSSVDGSNQSLTLVQKLVDSGAAIVVQDEFELVFVVVTLLTNAPSLGRDAGIIECSSGSLSIRHVTVLQTTMSGFLHRAIVLAVDTNVTISDCEVNRLSTKDGIFSLRYTNNTIPSFHFRNVLFVSCLPPSAVKIALTFSTKHRKVKMRDHFEKTALDWKHPEWYSLTVGKKHRSFLFDVVVHPVVWGVLGVAGLLALFIVPWLICTPAMFPVMMCYRRQHTKTDPPSRSHCCKCLLPDGGRGQREHEPWDAISLLNGIPNEYRYSTITDAKTRQQKGREEGEQPIDTLHLKKMIAADRRNNFQISDPDTTSHTASIHTTRQNRSRGASADSDSEDVLDSSDVSEEII
ncbi:hypothetical protein BLNAU_4033 [Blattamonas nauphoetae]|uniref:Uncharacterized protein n=1 Tax=Blattamonas nauphoetae TaxID=2049346 RepID=A0ABQ9YAZ9_9EUKA|nr:hypothetical protein BLNAU_4033 [Blattamonas nauphoetae]